METQENTQATQAQEQNPLQRTIPFNFRKQQPAQLAKQLEVNKEEVFKPEILANFDMLDANEKSTNDPEQCKWLKRKSEQHTIELPSILMDLPESERKYVADIMENTISTYLKVNFIDSFEPVGDHSWNTIKKWLDSKGTRGAKWDFDKETLESASKALGQYMSQLTSNEEVGNRVEAAAKTRFTRSSIQRHINDSSDETISKLQKRVNEFMTWLAENDEESMQEFQPVYDCWNSAFERLLRQESKNIDVAAAL